MNFSRNVKKNKKKGRLISSISIAPYDEFEINDLFEGEKAIGHPAYEKVKNLCDERVVISNKCITSKYFFWFWFCFG